MRPTHAGPQLSLLSRFHFKKFMEKLKIRLEQSFEFLAGALGILWALYLVYTIVMAAPGILVLLLLWLWITRPKKPAKTQNYSKDEGKHND